MRRLYISGPLSLLLLSSLVIESIPCIIASLPGLKGRKKESTETEAVRRIVIVSTRYLDQPASRLGLPRRTGVKDLLFLFLHWNPIGKSAEAFVRALSFSQPLLLAPPSLPRFFLARELSMYTLLACLLPPPLLFVSFETSLR